MSFTPFSEAKAQHSGHHGHEGHGAKKPAKKAPAKKRSRQGGPGAAAPGAVGEYRVAHHKMMRDMAVPYTGDPDVDFRVQMIPHHQGAIDMARVALRHANDPWTRQMAEGVIVEQQREIAEMQQWLARRGVTPPPGGQPRHTITANSYRTIPEEPGTRAELRGQSWAPGMGVPPASR
ncbi:MAG TPA: DUF305 domain-containing protein [Beijerinckiaceae bacterium]|nr:DUF305 domain-containing protein [Beijerinckiaceae bacterium]